MNNSMNRISDPRTKNEVKQILKAMSKALVDNSNALAKSHEIVNNSNDPMKRQKLERIHNELNESTQSYKNRFARVLGDMKYLAESPSDKMAIERVAQDLQRNDPNAYVDDEKLAKDLQDVAKSCLDGSNRRRGMDPRVVNKVVDTPSGNNFDFNKNDPGFPKSDRAQVFLPPKRMQPRSSRSPMRNNLHSGQALISRKPTGTTAYSNRGSTRQSPSPISGQMRLAPSKSTRGLPSTKAPTRGLTPTRSYKNIGQPPNNFMRGSFQPERNPRSPIRRLSQAIQRKSPTPLPPGIPGHSPAPRRFRRLDNGDLVPIDGNEPPVPLYKTAASPITRNVFRNEPKSPIIQKNFTRPKSPRVFGQPASRSPVQNPNQIKSSNRINDPETRSPVPKSPIDYRNSRVFKLPESPQLSERPLSNKNISLLPLAPPQQKYNKKRERLRSLSKNRSPHNVNKVKPAPTDISTIINNIPPLENSNVPITNVNEVEVDPGNVKNTPIKEKIFASGLQNGEYVSKFILIIQGHRRYQGPEELFQQRPDPRYSDFNGYSKYFTIS